MAEIIERRQFAVEIAHQAGQLTLRYFRRDGLQIETKSDQSPVTIADRAAEELMWQRIRAKYPSDAILGEELGERAGSSRFQWILDPIDGTKSFIHGVPLYTNLVAVLQNGEPAVGVIHAPATGETVFASTGCGCWYSPKPEAEPSAAGVSNVGRLHEGLLLTTEIDGFRQRPSGDATEVFMRLQRAARLSRTWGDGYGYLMVATGRAEVMIDPIVNLWDAACLLPIIEEAGGQFSDWNGNATIRAGEALATNGLVRSEVLEISWAVVGGIAGCPSLAIGYTYGLSKKIELAAELRFSEKR